MDTKSVHMWRAKLHQPGLFPIGLHLSPIIVYIQYCPTWSLPTERITRLGRYRRNVLSGLSRPTENCPRPCHYRRRAFPVWSQPTAHMPDLVATDGAYSPTWSLPTEHQRPLENQQNGKPTNGLVVPRVQTKNIAKIPINTL